MLQEVQSLAVQPVQPLLPASASLTPLLPWVNAANVDSTRSAPPWPWGHAAGSSIRLTGRSSSNRWLQLLQ